MEDRGRDPARRDRGDGDEPARADRHRRRPDLESRARVAGQPDGTRVASGPRHGSGRADRRGAEPAASQAWRIRDGLVLPAKGANPARAAAERARRLTCVCGVGRGRAARSGEAACGRGWQAERLGHLPGAPLRGGTTVRRNAAPLESRDLDALAGGHVRPARAHLHGRGVRLRASDGGATGEEADPDDPQAGSRVRCRHGAFNAKPGRPRLQGDVERCDLARRAPADRTRQGSGARGLEVGRWRN